MARISTPHTTAKRHTPTIPGKRSLQSSSVLLPPPVRDLPMQLQRTHGLRADSLKWKYHLHYPCPGGRTPRVKVHLYGPNNATTACCQDGCYRGRCKRTRKLLPMILLSAEDKGLSVRMYIPGSPHPRALLSSSPRLYLRLRL
jgi:hypothetical protein